MYTSGQIIQNAFLEAGIQQAGENVSAQDSAWGLQKFNDILDEWAARSVFAYTTNFQLLTLTAGLQPHTIGPTGTFVQTQVPVKIKSCANILSGTGILVDSPFLRIRDRAWWAAQSVKTLPTNVPTDLYYEPDQPNGSLYFWPVPNTNSQVRLEQETILSQLTSLLTPIVLPPGYRQAYTLTLAERLCPSYGREPSGELVRAAMLARKGIQGNNDKSPRIATADYGMPRAGRTMGTKADFNWETGDLT